MFQCDIDTFGEMAAFPPAVCSQAKMLIYGVNLDEIGALGHCRQMLLLEEMQHRGWYDSEVFLCAGVLVW